MNPEIRSTFAPFEEGAGLNDPRTMRLGFSREQSFLEDGDAVSLRVLDPEIGETILNFRLRGR